MRKRPCSSATAPAWSAGTATLAYSSGLPAASMTTPVRTAAPAWAAANTSAAAAIREMRMSERMARLLSLRRAVGESLLGLGQQRVRDPGMARRDLERLQVALAGRGRVTQAHRGAPGP